MTCNSVVSCHVIPEIRLHFPPLPLHFHYDMILHSCHSRIYTHRPCISGITWSTDFARATRCTPMLPFAVVFVLAAFNGGGGGGVATDIQDLSIAFPSSSTGHPPPSPPAHIVVARLGNSEFGLGLLGWFIPRGTSPALFPSLSFHYSVNCCLRYRAAPRRRRGGDDGGYRIVTWGGRSYLARWRPCWRTGKFSE